MFEKKTNVLFAGCLPQLVKYVDFIQRQLDIAKFVHVHIKVAKQELKRARILVTAKSRPSVRRHWLASLKHQFTPSNQIAASECFSTNSKKFTIAVLKLENNEDVKSTRKK